MKKTFAVYYTLKLYSFVFGIQKHSIDSLIKYNRKMKRLNHQVCRDLTLIFKNELIENTYRTKYAGEVIFEMNPDIGPTIIEFYQNYWKRSQHEFRASNPNLTIEECINSALFQYQRLYYWTQNNGYKRYIFKRMIDTFRKCFIEIVDRSEQIFKNSYLKSGTSIVQNDAIIIWKQLML